MTQKKDTSKESNITPEMKQAFLRNVLVTLRKEDTIHNDSSDIPCRRRSARVVYTCPICFRTVATGSDGLELECTKCGTVMIR